VGHRLVGCRLAFHLYFSCFSAHHALCVVDGCGLGLEPRRGGVWVLPTQR
jgi:hypothetical protein